MFNFLKIFYLKSVALAQGGVPPSEIPVPKPARAPGGSLVDLITVISNTILLLVGVVAVLFLIIGGVQYITSAGNPDSVNKAKTTILYAVIGIIVTLVAWAVVSFVISSIKG